MWWWGGAYAVPRALAVVAGCWLTCGHEVLAQAAPSSCLLSPAKLSDGLVTAFKEQPANLLAVYPGGGPTMSRYVSRLAASDISTVRLLIGLAKEANVAQLVAIGIGLAQASIICGRTQAELAEAIVQQVAQAAIPGLTSAFAVSLAPDAATQTAVYDASSDTGNGIANGLPASGGALGPAPAGGGGGPADASNGERPGLLLQFHGSGISKTSGRSVSPTR